MINTEFFTKSVESVELSQLSEIICDACEFPVEKSDAKIFNLANLQDGGTGCIGFFKNRKYIDYLKSTKCEFCFVEKGDIEYVSNDATPIVVQDSYLAMAKLTNYFYGCNNIPNIAIKKQTKFDESCKIADTACVDITAKLGKNVQIGENVVISPWVNIGDNVIISHNSIILKAVKIGSGSIISENCVIKYAIVGEKCLIHPGVKIGQDGFGFAHDKKTNKLEKITHLGIVKIGNNVEIGANATIDRGSFSDTVISDNVKLDNLVQVGHNVSIGNSTVIAGLTGIAGSTAIGYGCLIGGQVGIAGHIEIGNLVHIAGGSGVTSTIKDKSIIAGYPAIEINDWRKSSVILKKITQNWSKLRKSFED